MRNVILILGGLLLMAIQPGMAATSEKGLSPFDIVQLEQMVIVAEADFSADEIKQLKDSGNIMPLESILQLVQKNYEGRIIEVELDKEDKTYVYEIELVDDNNIVWELEVDAATGKVLKREQDD
ncbi:MAG: PepSY domain-containing protein [Gammaproteobacteria bacterium]